MISFVLRLFSREMKLEKPRKVKSFLVCYVRIKSGSSLLALMKI